MHWHCCTRGSGCSYTASLTCPASADGEAVTGEASLDFLIVLWQANSYSFSLHPQKPEMKNVDQGFSQPAQLPIMAELFIL